MTRFRLPDYHRLWSGFPAHSTSKSFGNSSLELKAFQARRCSYLATLVIYLAIKNKFRLLPFRSPLLRESRFLSLPQGTEMFHFPCLPSHALCVQAWIRAHYRTWVPPFRDPRVKGCSAPNRGLSQPAASFIGSQRQGIRHAPLIT